MITRSLFVTYLSQAQPLNFIIIDESILCNCLIKLTSIYLYSNHDHSSHYNLSISYLFISYSLLMSITPIYDSTYKLKSKVFFLMNCIY